MQFFKSNSYKSAYSNSSKTLNLCFSKYKKISATAKTNPTIIALYVSKFESCHNYIFSYPLFTGTASWCKRCITPLLWPGSGRVMSTYFRLLSICFLQTRPVQDHSCCTRHAYHFSFPFYVSRTRDLNDTKLIAAIMIHFYSLRPSKYSLPHGSNPLDVTLIQYDYNVWTNYEAFSLVSQNGKQL